MLPAIKNITPTQSLYLRFMEELETRKFKGDINPDYANRTVLSTDNSIYQVLPQGVIYPKDLNDLVICTELASEQQFTSIVLSPRGGGTGTNGQSLTDGILVDLSKYLNQILEINQEQRWARVQAGVVKDQLNEALKPFGLFFAPDLSTSNRATIGGMINTDASGQGSCVYGKTRDHVIELTTVIMDGSIWQSSAINRQKLETIKTESNRIAEIHHVVDQIASQDDELIKKIFPPLNRCLTGYDLAHIYDDQKQFNLNNILCGSEGTLGFIAEAKLNLLPIPKYTALINVKYENFEAALRDAKQLMQAEPTSIETIDSKVLNLAMKDFIWHSVAEFFPNDADKKIQGINLVEYSSDNEDLLKEQVKTLTNNLEKLANSPNQAFGYSIAWGRENVNKIWAMRKRAVGLLGNSQGEKRPVAFVEDTAVPPENLADFILEFRQILDRAQLDYGMFGHVDAGVLHVRPALDMKNPEQEKMVRTITEKVVQLTQKYNGLLWGEHGKGVRSEFSPAFFGDLYPRLQQIKKFLIRTTN